MKLYFESIKITTYSDGEIMVSPVIQSVEMLDLDKEVPCLSWKNSQLHSCFLRTKCKPHKLYLFIIYGSGLVFFVPAADTLIILENSQKTIIIPGMKWDVLLSPFLKELQEILY